MKAACLKMAAEPSACFLWIAGSIYQIDKTTFSWHTVAIFQDLNPIYSILKLPVWFLQIFKRPTFSSFIHYFKVWQLLFFFFTSVMTGALCLWQVMKTTKGQSSGCMRTPAAWAQVGWNAVEQRPWEHWTQQPVTSLFIRFLQYTHFYGSNKDEEWRERGRKGGEKETRQVGRIRQAKDNEDHQGI